MDRIKDNEDQWRGREGVLQIAAVTSRLAMTTPWAQRSMNGDEVP
jgi:hypothetical protein